MSTKAAVWTIIVIILVILGGWWYMKDNKNYSSNTTYTATTSGQNPAQQNGAMATVSASSNSDASLEKDASNVDAQMSGLNSDNASADQSLSK
ncbi:MAG: hypothetical protein WCG97_01305 [bacterium]